MLTFRLIKKCFQDASFYKKEDVDFLLEENDWNDYGYCTSYHLHMTKKRNEQLIGALYLGLIQIMKLGQPEEKTYLLRSEIKDTTFSTLPEGFYSISFSLDIFGTLSQYLNKEEREEFVRSLRLILSENDEYHTAVKDDPCFNTSLLRNATMDSYNLVQARDWLFQEGINYNLREKTIKIEYSDSDTPVELDFGKVKELQSDFLPNGIIAFIGKNGSGKSTALYKMAALLYASPSDRDRHLTEFGKITPNDLGIAQLMIFSYTPFDNFYLPGMSDDSGDLKLWADRISKREGRFIFCGIRDVEKEAIQAIEQKREGKFDRKHLRVENIFLKELSALANEAYEAYCQILSDDSTTHEWADCVSEMEGRHDEVNRIAKRLHLSHFERSEWNAIFQSMSTGHKFFFHSLLHIIAYCQSNALLLFDEPENHLQAPLLSFMMAQVRKIIAKRNSVMLIATHSPVIIQETMGCNVRIVRREGERVSFMKPKIETFGENFGTISSEVFDLTTDRVYYFDYIDEVYNHLGCDRMRSAEEALDKIIDIMGDISNQTIQYVVGKFYSSHRTV